MLYNKKKERSKDKDDNLNKNKSEKILETKKDEIKIGDASILTTINGNNVESFKINIIKIKIKK